MEENRILYVLNAIGLDGIFRTILNSISRDIIDRQYREKTHNSEIIIAGSLGKLEQIPNGLKADFQNASLEIIYLSKYIARITWEPGQPQYPYTIANFEWPTLFPKHYNQTDYHVLEYGDISILIGNQGNLVYKISNHEPIKIDESPSRQGGRWHLSTILKPDEHIYGLGERSASLNLRPGNYSSWNSEFGGRYTVGTDPLYIGTPIYLSISSMGNYLVYFENSFRSNFAINEKITATFNGGRLRYYVIFGSLEVIYKQLGDLIGFSYLPPRWSLGYHQSRWGYRSSNDIRKVIKGFETHQLPISAIHLDIDYMDGYRVFTINSQSFPDLKYLTNEMDEKGIKVVASINPAVKNDHRYKVYSEGSSKNLFCKLPNGKTLGGVSWPGWSVFPDFTNPETRKWWADQYEYLINLGISGIWHDMNEPSSFAAWGDISFPKSTIHNLDGKLGNHEEAHNLYGLLMNKSCYDGFRKHAPNQRPWIFSRSGWTGLQRYAWNWTGDVISSWASLKQSIAMILGLGLSGHAFSGVDIGGYTGNPDAELYLRWFQMATFFPLFRTHSAIGTKHREPWVFGEPTTSIIRKFLTLRYQLIPYLYTLVFKNTLNGIPPIRPIFWDSPSQTYLWDVDDEFLFGESLLIAPIVTKGARTRKIILPPGDWYYFWDDHRYYGTSEFTINVDFSTIPIFVKAGSIIPNMIDGKLILHIYPDEGNEFSGNLYSDAGDGYGDWRLDTYRINSDQKSMEITWDTQGGYPLPYENISILLHSKHILSANSEASILQVANNSLKTPLFRKIVLNLAN